MDKFQSLRNIWIEVESIWQQSHRKNIINDKSLSVLEILGSQAEVHNLLIT